MPLTQTDRLLTFSSPLGADAFVLTRVAGREELSRPFAFTLELASENTAVAPADLVGRAVSWKVNSPADNPRHFHGYVRRLTTGPVDRRDLRTYRAEVVPWLWFLTRTADCRIYQNMSVPDILADVFGRFGFASAFSKKLSGSYPKRDYTVQYRETAFDFVSRLMEEVGIYYLFEHTAAAHTLVLADGTAAYTPCAAHAAPEFRLDPHRFDVISEWNRSFTFGSGKVAHTDYNFETPSASLLSDDSSNLSLTGLSKYELYDYPGRYPVKGDGKSLARVRIEEVEATYDTAAGASRCATFVPGGTFAMKEHSADNGSYVLLAVEHTATEDAYRDSRGTQTEYRNTFVAAPAATPFRPARTTPKPTVPGAQTAVVVGPKGEEIYTDKYGRVKVQFHWDRLGKKDENSSCWLRVSELWAGKQWGMVFTPRIGQEVVVEFLEGDPDRPLVTGRVYNAEQMPPYALPANMTQSGLKTRSTKGAGEADFNELRFEDAKGKEDIYFHAQKDFHRFVEHDDDLKVEHDQTIQIKNNRTLTVQEGYEKITIDKGDRERTVTLGNDTLTVSKGDRTVLVSKGNASVTVATGNRLMTVASGNYVLAVSKGALLIGIAKGGMVTTVKADCKTTVQEGNRETTVERGNDAHTVAQGNREAKVEQGNESLTVSRGNITTTAGKGDIATTAEKGNITVKADAGAITLEAKQSITLKVGSNKIVIDPSGIVIEATAKIVVNPGGITGKGVAIAWKGDAQFKAEAAIVQVTGAAGTEIKGAIVKIN